jgi:hypothetical protein
MIQDLYNRKFGVGEIFKACWGIFFRNLKYLFVFGFLLAVILKALDFLAFMPLATVSDDKMVVMHLKSLISGVFGFIGCLIAVFIAEQSVADKEVSWSLLFEKVRKFFWAAFAIHIITQLICTALWLPDYIFRLSGHREGLEIFLGILLILAGMVLCVYFAFTFQALVLREQTWLSSFRYSFRIVRGRLWKVLGMMIAILIILMIPTVFLSIFFKRFLHITSVNGWSVAYPFFMFFSMYAELFFTVLFINLDRQKSSSSRSC